MNVRLHSVVGPHTGAGVISKWGGAPKFFP